MLANIADLQYIRQAATTTKSPALSVITNYDRVIQAFITFSNDVAAGTGNATLQSDVSVLNALLRMEDDASLQRAYLYQALAGPQPTLTPSALTDLNQATEQQQADTNASPGGDGHRAADAEQHRRRSAGRRGEERGEARRRHRQRGQAADHRYAADLHRPRAGGLLADHAVRADQGHAYGQ